MMTLSRQLVFSGMIILLCLFVGMITYVVKNTQTFLNQQLASHAQDAATALGLTLSTTMKGNDLVTAGRIVDAIFDSGFYKSIEVNTINGAPILERKMPVKMHNVPGWFINFFHINTEQREALIMDGWKKIGMVKIESNPGFGYQQIWLTFIDSLRWLIVTAAIAIVLGSILLHIILRPLRAITAQAIAICNQQFPIQQKLPWTIDLRQVVEAMNNMARRLKNLFEEHAKVSEQLQEQAFKDPVSDLGNRRYFDLQLDYLLNDPEKGGAGALLFIELIDFKGYNDKFGYQAGDQLLKQVAQILLNESLKINDAIVAHIKGADFAILLPNKTKETSEELASILCQRFFDLHIKDLSKTIEVANIGIALYKQGDDKKEIFAQADMALRAAQVQGANQWKRLVGIEPTVVHGAKEWAEIFTTAIRENKILLDFQEVQIWSKPESHFYETYMRLQLANKEIVTAGIFIPMAERLNRIVDLDKCVIEKVIGEIRKRDKSYQFYVNISPTFLVDQVQQQWLLDQVKSLKSNAKNLIIELREWGVINYLEKARALFHDLKVLGCKTSIDHYGKNFTSFSYLYNLKVNYLKIDGSFVKGIDVSEENQFFVKSLVNIAHSLDILVIAEAVETQAEFNTLKGLAVDGVQGYFIHKPGELSQ